VDVGAGVLFNAPPAVPRLLQHFYAPWRTFDTFPARRDTVERLARPNWSVIAGATWSICFTCWVWLDWWR
jgi:hypothetical protein